MKITFEKLKYELINESSNKNFGYHCTNTNPEIIKREGFKVGNNGFTKENMFEDLYQKYLPRIPIFISANLKTSYYMDSKYCIVLDINGLDLYPDFGAMPDIGAYYDYDSELFYWDRFGDIKNSKIRQFVRSEYGEPILYARDFTGELSWQLIKSACLDGQQDLIKRIINIIDI